MAFVMRQLIMMSFATYGGATPVVLSGCQQGTSLGWTRSTSTRHGTPRPRIGGRNIGIGCRRPAATGLVLGADTYCSCTHRVCAAGPAGPVSGIDGRSSGGYIVWWPAADEPILCDAPPAKWPAWLLGDLCPLSAPRQFETRVTVPDEYRLAGLVRKVANARKGDRNRISFWAACRAGEMVASGLIDADYAAAVIASAATMAGLPPTEAERTAWSGIRNGSGASPHTRNTRSLR